MIHLTIVAHGVQRSFRYCLEQCLIEFEIIDCPRLHSDQGITALVEDLDASELEQDVSVVAWGELGRTPRINPGGGRGHWPRASCALLAGGGIRMGQVIGSTSRPGEVPQDRPIHYQDVFASLYHQCGIDVRPARIPDTSGRPQCLLDHQVVVKGLISGFVKTTLRE